MMNNVILFYYICAGIERSAMAKLVFEEKGPAILEQIGMSKAEFARRMGIQRQNVNVLFTTKNFETIFRAAQVMGVPFSMLVGYSEEPDRDIILDDESADDTMIVEDDIPTGNTSQDRRKRQQLIMSFYQEWKRRNPEQKRFNISLQEDINIRSVSVVETAAQASLTYLSTLAVLQLDAILTNARMVRNVPSKAGSKNQRAFERMIIMEYICMGVGRIKMTVGIRRSDKMRIQYCITAIDAGKIKQEA